MKKIFPILIFFKLIYCSPINEIKIIGNKFTKNEIILREIHHPLNIEFSDSIQVEDQNRLYNLGIFSFVEIKHENQIYLINLIEVPRYYPLPLFDIDESKGEEGTSYGLVLKFLNFKGRNQDLLLGGMYGNKNIYFLQFNDPWIIGDHISLNAKLYKFSSNKLRYINNTKNTYLYKIYGFEFGSGFNIKNHNKFKFEISLTEKSLVPDGSINFSSNFSKYQNVGLDLNYSFDTRNIYNDPTNGFLFNIGLEYFFGINEAQSYSNILVGFQKFFKIFEKREITLINRSNLLIQNENHIPYFKVESLGGEEFIRGYNPDPTQNPIEVQNKIRASQLISQSIEIQYTLFKKKSYSNIELGLDQIWFFDIGFGGSTLDQMISNKPIMGFGLGFRMFISGVATFGLDFGFNPYTKNPQIHLTDDN